MDGYPCSLCLRVPEAGLHRCPVTKKWLCPGCIERQAETERALERISIERAIDEAFEDSIRLNVEADALVERVKAWRKRA